MRYLIILAALLAPALAGAADQGYVVPFGGQVCASSGVPCVSSGNACSGTATYTIELAKKYSKVRALVDYTHSTGTSLTLTPRCTLTDEGTFGKYGSRAITAGASTVSPLVETWTPGATDAIMPEFDTRGCYDFRLSVAINGCTLSSVAVTLTGIAGQ